MLVRNPKFPDFWKTNFSTASNTNRTESADSPNADTISDHTSSDSIPQNSTNQKNPSSGSTIWNTPATKHSWGHPSRTRKAPPSSDALCARQQTICAWVWSFRSRQGIQGFFWNLVSREWIRFPGEEVLKGREMNGEWVFAESKCSTD